MEMRRALVSFCLRYTVMYCRQPVYRSKSCFFAAAAAIYLGYACLLSSARGNAESKSVCQTVVTGLSAPMSICVASPRLQMGNCRRWC